MSKFIITGFADEIDDSLEKQMETLKELGVKYIEMRGVNGKNLSDHEPNEAKAIKKILDENGFKLSAVGSPIGKIGINDDFEPHFKKFKKVVEIARIMETKYIRMFSFFIDKGDDPAEYKERVLSYWKRFADYAAENGIMLLHENEKDIYGDTAERCKDILDSCDSSTVRGIFDPANFVQCGVDTKAAFEMLKDDIVYMHIKDAVSGSGKVVPSGEGDGNLEYILKSLCDRGYEGFLSLEPHLETGDIAVCGADKFKVAHKALMDIITKLDAEIA